MPLTTFFPPDIPLDAKPQVQVLTAIRLLPNDERYIPATIVNTLVQIDADGRSAHIAGMVLSQTQDASASQVWVAGTAYNEAGGVVGVRRWEWNDGLAAGGSIPFEFMISSIGGKIAAGGICCGGEALIAVGNGGCRSLTWNCFLPCSSDGGQRIPVRRHQSRQQICNTFQTK